MRFLFCAGISYCGKPRTYDPMYYYFNDTFTEMGHKIDCIDTYKPANDEKSREEFNAYILKKVMTKKYAAVIVATYKNEFFTETLDEIRKHTITIAWNSDDDWRWDSYSKYYATHYDLMYTTYKDIYERNKAYFSSLRLSQWACLGKYDGLHKKKDMPFSFVGRAYGDRLKMLYQLHKKNRLEVFGKETAIITGNYTFDRILKLGNRALRKFTNCNLLLDDYISFEQVNEIWCRSKISLNLMRSSQGDKLQIKSRTFDMGVSGTMMVCEHSPNLELYYEPYKEFVPFENIEDCSEKVRYYLAHNKEREKIAMACYERTKKEHLWKHRINQILKDTELTK